MQAMTITSTLSPINSDQFLVALINIRFSNMNVYIVNDNIFAVYTAVFVILYIAFVGVLAVNMLAFDDLYDDKGT